MFQAMERQQGSEIQSGGKRAQEDRGKAGRSRCDEEQQGALMCLNQETALNLILVVATQR